MGALNLVVAKGEIAGTDPFTYISFGLGILAIILSFLAPPASIRRLIIIVFGIALVEFGLLPFSMPLLVRVFVGIVLLVIGVGWMVRARKKAHATKQRHTQAIHAALDRVDTALKNASPSNLGNSDATIIAKHFPKIAGQAQAWDAAVKGVADYRQRIRESAESRLRALGADKQPCNFDIIHDGLCAITEARAANGAYSSQPLPPMTGNPNQKPIFTFFDKDAIRTVFLAFNEATGVRGDLLRLVGDSYPSDAAQYKERYAKPIYDLLRDMQTWDSTDVLSRNLCELKKFETAELKSAVEKERGKAYYPRVKGCPGCQGK